MYAVLSHYSLNNFADIYSYINTYINTYIEIQYFIKNNLLSLKKFIKKVEFKLGSYPYFCKKCSDAEISIFYEWKFILWKFILEKLINVKA